MIYALDDRGALTPGPVPFVATRPGAGPRHLAFGADGRTVYATHELDVTLGTYRWDVDAGTLEEIACVSLLDGGHDAGQTAADVRVAPSGRFVYASVRGDDAIVAHAVDASDGTLARVERVSSEGSSPRAFALDPSGRWLVVANHRSDAIALFAVDAESGRLAFTGRRADVPSPVCACFFAPGA